MRIIDGSAIAEKKLGELAKRVQGHRVHLAAVLVGEDPGLKKFVELKKKAAESIGIQFSTYQFSEAQAEEVKETLRWLSEDETIQGVLVELPLPPSYNTQDILNRVPTKKDVDVLSSDLQADYYAGKETLGAPAVGALQEVFRNYDINPKGKKIAVFGQGMLVGKPISYWLKRQGAEVFEIDINTLNPKRYSLEADILISGVGKADLITEDMVKDGAVVIDYGFPSGDVDVASVSKKALLITPVPGGMGPLVIAAVLENLVISAGL